MTKRLLVVDSSKCPTYSMAKLFQPSCELRWSENKELLQAWICRNTGEVEWRQVATFDPLKDVKK